MNNVIFPQNEPDTPEAINAVDLSSFVCVTFLDRAMLFGEIKSALGLVRASDNVGGHIDDGIFLSLSFCSFRSW
jgi:hypothetical protein